MHIQLHATHILHIPGPLIINMLHFHPAVLLSVSKGVIKDPHLRPLPNEISDGLIFSEKHSTSVSSPSLLSFLCISELFSDSGWDSDICNSVIYWPSLASGWMPSIIHLSEAAAGPSPKWQLAFSNLIRKKERKKKAPGYSMEILGEGLLRSDKIDWGTITEGTIWWNTSRNCTFSWGAELLWPSYFTMKQLMLDGVVIFPKCEKL